MINNPFLETIDPLWLSVFAFVVGAFVGSFLNVCIYRIPRGESIVFPRSRCPSCKTRIRPYHNIPLISYVVLRGRCPSCRETISPRYPLVEFLTALIALLLERRFGASVEFVGYFAFSAALIVVSGIDLAHRIIPDRISLPGIAAGLIFSLVTFRMTLLDSVVGTVTGGGSLLLVTLAYMGYVKLRERFKGVAHEEETAKALKGMSLEELKKEAALYGVEVNQTEGRQAIVRAIADAKSEGMGGGDIKLLAMIGAFLGGWQPILFVILVGSFLGCVVGVPLMVSKGRDSKYAIPFGPFLAGGAVIFLIWGTEIIRWYFGLGRHG